MQSLNFIKRTCLAVSLALGLTASAAATSYPNQPIRIIVPFAAAGTTDLIARLVGNHLANALGQPVIVENKAGAGGNIGAEFVARARPDGYVLQLGTAGNLTVNPSIYSNMRFDPIKDFQPISLIATLPNLMVVNKDVPANNVQEFVAWARQRPGEVFFASAGNGSTLHLTGELFNMVAGVSLTHVPYKGSGPALAEVVGGTGPVVMFDNMSSAIGLVRSGTLRALAVTGPKREDSAPEIPTMMQSGYPDFNVVTWFGLFAPAGTPQAIVQRLNEEIVKIVETPDVAQRLQALGATPVSSTPEELGTIMKSDTKRWADVIRQAKISTQH